MLFRSLPAPVAQPRRRRRNVSEPRVDGLGLEREHREDAFVHAVERLAAHEALERLDAERAAAGTRTGMSGDASPRFEPVPFEPPDSAGELGPARRLRRLSDYEAIDKDFFVSGCWPPHVRRTVADAFTRCPE